MTTTLFLKAAPTRACKTMHITVLAMTFLLVALWLGREALAQSTLTADEHDEQARAYFKAGAFLLAAEEFDKANEIESTPSRLFNTALAFENAGKKREAAKYYGKYLALEGDTSGERAIEARARKAAIDESIAKADRLEKQAAAAEAERAAAEAERAAAETEKTRRAWKHAEIGKGKVEAGRYEQAAEAYQDAYQANANAEYIFLRAEALRLGAKNRDERIVARDAYRQYLQQAPSGPNYLAATRWQEQLEKANSSPSSSGSVWSSIGLVTAGLGAVGVGASVFFGLEASKLESDLESLDSAEGDAWSPGQEQKLEDGESAANWSQGLAIAGGAMLVGGVVIYFVGRGEESSTPVSLSPTLGSQSAGVAVSGRF